MPLRLSAAVALIAALALPARAADAPGDDFFLPTKVWDFHITIPAKEFAAMQAPAGAMPQFGAPPPKAAPKPKPGEDVREVHRNMFGVDQPWAKGSFTAEGKTFEVGLRYKGNGTFLESGQNLKKSIKVDLDKHVAEQRYHGLKTLNLHSGVADPSKCRESLAYAVYRHCGVPSARTTLAEVRLTVPGKHDKVLLGIYTVVEQVDSAFLRTNFKTDKGLLMKPERMRGLDFLGDDWARYEPTYLPKRDATLAEQKRVIEFTRLVNRADDATFNREIGNYLDVDGFLRFMAVSGLVVSLDSFFTLGHNYYLYLHPETQKFHFFPWDLDRSLANFGIFGTNDQQMDMSIAQPYTPPQRLVDRLLAMKGVPEKNKAIVKELMATSFTKERLLGTLEPVEKAVKEPMAREATAVKARRETNTNPFGPGLGVPPPLHQFIDKRIESVNGQLDGSRKGHVPVFGFGGPPPAPGNQLAKPLLGALDASKDGKVSEEEMLAGMRRLFSEWDKDRNGVLDEKEIQEGLQKLLPPPPGPPGKK